MKPIATHYLLTSDSFNFFDNRQWPAYSTELFAGENLGAILKDRVKESILNSGEKSRSNRQSVRQIIEAEQSNME